MLLRILADPFQILVIFGRGNGVDAHVEVGGDHPGEVVVAAGHGGVPARLFHQLEHLGGVPEDPVIAVTAQFVELIPVDADPVLRRALIDGPDAVLEKFFVGGSELFRIHEKGLFLRNGFVEEVGQHVGEASDGEPADHAPESGGLIGLEEIVHPRGPGIVEVQLGQLFPLIEHFEPLLHVLRLGGDGPHGLAHHVAHAALVALKGGVEAVLPDELELPGAAVVAADDGGKILSQLEGGHPDGVVQRAGGEIPALEGDLAPVDPGFRILRHPDFQIIGQRRIGGDVLGGLTLQQFGDVPVLEPHEGFPLGPDPQIADLGHGELVAGIGNGGSCGNQRPGGVLDGVDRKGLAFGLSRSGEHHQLTVELFTGGAEFGMELTVIVDDVAPQTGIGGPHFEFHLLPPGRHRDVLEGGGDGELAHGGVEGPQGAFGLTLDVFRAFGGLGGKGHAAEFQFDPGRDEEAEERDLAVGSHLGREGEVELDVSRVDGLDGLADILVHPPHLPLAALVAAVDDEEFIFLELGGGNGQPDLAALHLALNEEDSALFLLPFDGPGDLFPGKVGQDQIRARKEHGGTQQHACKERFFHITHLLFELNLSFFTAADAGS